MDVGTGVSFRGGIAGADSIAVALLEGAFSHDVAGDAVAALQRGQRFRLEDCISGWTKISGETTISADLEHDVRIRQALDRGCPMPSCVMTPVGSPDPAAAIGAYGCAYVEPDLATITSRLTVRAGPAATATSRAPCPADTACRAG